MQVRPKDIRFDTFATTPNFFNAKDGVRLTYLPTGVSFTSSIKNRPHLNKSRCIAQLENYLLTLEQDKAMTNDDLEHELSKALNQQSATPSMNKNLIHQQSVLFDGAIKIAAAIVGTIHNQADYERLRQLALTHNQKSVGRWIAKQAVNQAIEVFNEVNSTLHDQDFM